MFFFFEATMRCAFHTDAHMGSTVSKPAVDDNNDEKKKIANNF